MRVSLFTDLDTLCSGCSENKELGEEILLCTSFGKNSEKIPYGWFYSDKVEDQILVARIVKKLKIRQKILEEIT